MKKFIYTILFSFAFLGLNTQSFAGQPNEKAANPFTVLIPNGFSPESCHGSACNFSVGLEGGNHKAFEMTIFNRWGEQLFTSNSPDQQKGWDGKYLGNFVNADTYVAQVKIQAQDGKWYFYSNAVQVVL